MINYLELIGSNYPTTQVYTLGSVYNYDDIIWMTQQITKEELVGLYLTSIKYKKLESLSKLAQMKIISGFKSTALGYPHVYDSQIEDQLNLIGSVATQSDMLYSCRPSTKGSHCINFGGLLSGTYTTGLTNDATQYSSIIKVDGINHSVTVLGSSVQTIDQLIQAILNTEQLNLKIDINITNGNFTITSKSYGNASTILIINNNLFSSVVGFASVQNPQNGIDAYNKEYKSHTHQQLLKVINDGKDIKLQILQTFLYTKTLVLAATTEEQIAAITWS